MMEPDSLLSPARWIAHLLTGNAALAVATIAIAIIGIALFSGRIPIRRGVETVLGIAIIFGAPIISRDLVGDDHQRTAIRSRIAAEPIAVDSRSATAVYDPYAGASVPHPHPGTDNFVPIQ